MNQIGTLTFGLIGVAVGAAALLTTSTPLLIGIGSGALFTGIFLIRRGLLN